MHEPRAAVLRSNECAPACPQLVKLKTKELANVKKLASVILQKRNEVETFLLESIEMVRQPRAHRVGALAKRWGLPAQVKVEIGRRRVEEERGRSSKGRLPALAASRPSNLPNSLEVCACARATKF